MIDELELEFLNRLKAQRSSQYPDFLLTQGVYADFLRERGDERSDLLRFSIQVRRYSPDRWHIAHSFLLNLFQEWRKVNERLRAKCTFCSEINNLGTWKTKAFVPEIELSRAWDQRVWVWTERSLMVGQNQIYMH